MTPPIRLHFHGARVTGIYSDAVAPLLDALGVKQVTRASHVEYDNALGGWTVAFPDGTFLEVLGDAAPHVFPTRQAALDAEVSEIEQRLRQGAA